MVSSWCSCLVTTDNAIFSFSTSGSIFLLKNIVISIKFVHVRECSGAFIYQSVLHFPAYKKAWKCLTFNFTIFAGSIICFDGSSPRNFQLETNTFSNPFWWSLLQEGSSCNAWNAWEDGIQLWWIRCKWGMLILPISLNLHYDSDFSSHVRELLMTPYMFFAPLPEMSLGSQIEI